MDTERRARLDALHAEEIEQVADFLFTEVAGKAIANGGCTRAEMDDKASALLDVQRAFFQAQYDAAEPVPMDDDLDIIVVKVSLINHMCRQWATELANVQHVFSTSTAYEAWIDARAGQLEGRFGLPPRK